MQVEQLLDLLKRSEVKEIALQSGRPPCALIGDQYKPIVNKMISEEQIMVMLGQAGGRTEILGLLDGPRRWDHAHGPVGLVHISAAYHGKVLQVRLRLKAPQASANVPRTTQSSGQGAPANANAAPQARPAPAAAPQAAADKRIPNSRRSGPPPARTTSAGTQGNPFAAAPASPSAQGNPFAAPAGADAGFDLELPPTSAKKPAPAPAASPFDFDAHQANQPARDDALDWDMPPVPDADGFEFENSSLAEAANPGQAKRPTQDGSGFGFQPVGAKPLDPSSLGGWDAKPPRKGPFASPPPEPARAARPQTFADQGNGYAAPQQPAPSQTRMAPAAPPQRAPAPAPVAPQVARAPKPVAHAHVEEEPEQEVVLGPASNDVPWGNDEDSRRLESLLRMARELYASDLHIVSDRPPMLRIAGDLLPQGKPIPHELVERMLLPRVPPRVIADLHTHGSCDYALQHPQLGRFRANVSRQRTGMKLTARPIPSRVPTLEDLGLPDSISGATHHHQGLIVVTGPTGHGKTTTLAAIVDIINSTRTHHVITVEDPVEFVHPVKKAMISQREVGSHTKKFASALKGSLREDPDVIVVGELRDTETVRMALSASETGHLVISTMNTPSASKAIERIIDLFPPGDQPQVRLTLAGGLRLVISQRLVPTPDGKGLVCAAELLPGTPPLWALIRDNKTFQIPSLQQRGKALGIVRLDDSLAALVKMEKTTLELAKQFAEQPDQLEAIVLGKSVRQGEGPLTAESFDPTAQAAQRGIQMGKDVLSKAGRLFGDKK